MIKNRQEILCSLIERLHQALKEMHNGQNFPFGEFKLNPQQVMVLFFIAGKKEGVSVKELAKLVRVTPGAVTQFIDIFVEKKLVKRKINPDDRRVVNIKLTPTAEKKFSNFKKSYFLVASRVFEDFSFTDLEKFNELLGKIKSPVRKG